MHTELKLKEEKLEIVKSWIRRGNVSVHSDVYTEDITINVPVEVEDLIIEKEENGRKETMRIPISRERVEPVKSKKIINEVTVYIRCFEEIKNFKVDLSSEKLKIEEKRFQQN